MGAYMATPSTEKVATSGHTEWFTYVASSMQGWRIQQEDAHNCLSDFDPARHASLFAVYDGHGGAEVARYCATYLPDFLRKLPAYANSQDPVEALKQLFLQFDASLTTPETRAILRSLAKSTEDHPADSFEGLDDSEDEEEEEDAEEDEDVEESDSEISALQAEAEQPLESVLQRYGGKEALSSPLIKDLADRRRQTKLGECSQSGGSQPNAPESDARSEQPASPKQAADHPTQNGSTPKNTETIANGTETADNETKTAKDEDVAAEDDDSDDDTVELDTESDDDDDDEESDLDSDDDGDEDEEEEDDDDDVENLGFRLPAALKGQDDSEPGVDSGTTACVALLLPMDGVVKLFVANAGDSRAVLCRGAAAVELSVDHKPEDEDEKSRITAAGGTVTRDGRVNGGLNLSRALGDHCYKQAPNLPLSDQMITPAPDVSQFDLIPGADDFLVIACDGVWNSMSSQEVVSFVYDRLHPQSPDPAPQLSPEEEAQRLSKICEELFDHCLAPNTDGDGTGCDNMTCIIVRFRDLATLAKLPPGVPTQVSSPVTGRKRNVGALTGSLADDPTAATANGVSNGSNVTVTPKRLRTEEDRTAAAIVPNGDAAAD